MAIPVYSVSCVILDPGKPIKLFYYITTKTVKDTLLELSRIRKGLLFGGLEKR